MKEPIHQVCKELQAAFNFMLPEDLWILTHPHTVQRLSHEETIQSGDSHCAENYLCPSRHPKDTNPIRTPSCSRARAGNGTLASAESGGPSWDAALGVLEALSTRESDRRSDHLI